MRILLVEDDALLGDGLRAGLRQLGFNVDWVRDGQAAERELRAANHDAAVLDLGLPMKDGMDVLAAARAEGVKLPVLVLTARDALSERIRGLDLGADDYVLKPVSEERLQRTVQRLQRALDSGEAAERFARMVRSLGGPKDVLRDPGLASAPCRAPVLSA